MSLHTSDELVICWICCSGRTGSCHSEGSDGNTAQQLRPSTLHICQVQAGLCMYSGGETSILMNHLHFEDVGSNQPYNSFLRVSQKNIQYLQEYINHTPGSGLKIKLVGSALINYFQILRLIGLRFLFYVLNSSSSFS